MAIIRVKRVETLASPTLKPGELGVINTDLYFGRWNAIDGSAISATKLANQTASNTFTGVNDFVPVNTTAHSVQFYNYHTETPTVQTYVQNGVIYGPTPTNAGQLANKGYVDSAIQGLDIKDSVRVLHDYAMDTGGPNYGLSGLTTPINGVTLANGDRVLVHSATSGAGYASTGIWIARSAAWTRATDFADGTNQEGSFVFVESGTNHANTGWVFTSATVGTGGVFTQFSGAGTYEADGGTLELFHGTTFRIKDGGVDLTGNKITGALTYDHGGTGFSSYATGDILYASNTNTLSKLPKEADGKVLKLVGGLPRWRDDDDTTYLEISEVEILNTEHVAARLLSGRRFSYGLKNSVDFATAFAGTKTVNFVTGATAEDATKTINFGTGGVGGSTTALNMAQGQAGSTATVNIASAGGMSSTINIGASNSSYSINIGGVIKISSTANTAGNFYTGTTDPTNDTTRLNYSGNLYATEFIGLIDGGVWS